MKKFENFLVTTGIVIVSIFLVGAVSFGVSLDHETSCSIDTGYGYVKPSCGAKGCNIEGQNYTWDQLRNNVLPTKFNLNCIDARERYYKR